MPVNQNFRGGFKKEEAGLFDLAFSSADPMLVPRSGIVRMPRGKKSRKNRSRKWSLKYKKSINCKSPKGFSQRQYCKYGRK
jgi:hypothetical protein